MEKETFMGNPSRGLQLLSKYIRHCRAIGIVWCLFTIGVALLSLLVFVSDQWAGDTEQAKSNGHFGPWRFCTQLVTPATDEGSDVTRIEHMMCLGDLTNFASIVSTAFRASTVLSGLATVLNILCVLCIVLFIFMRPSTVLHMGAVLQLLAGLSMALAIAIFPVGLNNDHVRTICGPETNVYEFAGCNIRWALVLAVIVVIDNLVLAILAYTLAKRVPKPAPPAEPIYMNPSTYRGEVNGGFVGDVGSVLSSRKSLPPMLMMPGGPETLYDPTYSHIPSARMEGNVNNYQQIRPASRQNQAASSIQNFQL